MILIIDKSRKNALALADAFYYMGVIAVAKTPAEALSEISLAYRAVIINEPSKLPDKFDYVRRLRSYASGIPVFAITDGSDELERGIFEVLFKHGIHAPKLFSKIIDYLIENRLRLPGGYRLAGIDCSVDLPKTTYFGTPVSLTRTENMILRTLIRFYPTPLSSEEILKYAFRERRMPEAATVRTHISLINKKMRDAAERNIIESVPSQGYRILTPELLKTT